MPRLSLNPTVGSTPLETVIVTDPGMIGVLARDPANEVQSVTTVPTPSLVTRVPATAGVKSVHVARFDVYRIRLLAFDAGAVLLVTKKSLS